jgi:hypothetical protein
MEDMAMAVFGWPLAYLKVDVGSQLYKSICELWAVRKQ